MTEPGLRARKKARTRAHIAATAARLFGAKGYEHVAVRDVARAAEVSEQTVYNYFPTKQHLALDRREEFEERSGRLVADRAPGISPAAALRQELAAEIALLRAQDPEQARGELPALTQTSPYLRRLTLESRDRQADGIAVALAATDNLAPAVAKAHAMALVWPFQMLVDEVGPRLLAGEHPASIADELGPAMLAVLDDLDGRL
ncbi:TetR/AcrR family transcriptional regulator [Actinomycetospora endophytica]|uniref:TetR/AcrR family transcriptional regulator n=1 Tax=Actinomycetospora endophytica TaxID=2291215 RepID=A0ABS8P2P8_9PSEU|nr:TetR/AcrR family transcriptional regulator [Actinomycetospora endophytica]MCD2191840.1 TetR/AcrR family transcriptional regulator [Actinomycetospora endophytica]